MAHQLYRGFPVKGTMYPGYNKLQSIEANLIDASMTLTNMYGRNGELRETRRPIERIQDGIKYLERAASLIEPEQKRRPDYRLLYGQIQAMIKAMKMFQRQWGKEGVLKRYIRVAETIQRVLVEKTYRKIAMASR